MNNLKVAITGGIGSGKSTLINIIKDLGYKVFSCDAICANLYKKQSVLRQIKKIFPTAVSGKIFLKADKKKISSLTFNNDKNYSLLSNFLQPLIVNELLKKMQKVKGVCFAEVPLLFEGNHQALFDKTIVLLRDKEERIKGVYNRSKIDKESFMHIANRQVDYDKIDLSNCFVIFNNHYVEDLALKFENFLSTIE